jgi:hypothetical protein
MEELRAEFKRDHDTLIRVETKVTSLCGQFNEFKDEMRERFDKLESKFLKDEDDCKVCKDNLVDKINDSNKGYLKWGHFSWIISGIAGVFVTALFIFGTTIFQNKQIIFETNHTMNDHIAYSVLVFEEITGKQWGQATREELDAARQKYLETRQKAIEEDISDEAN